MCVRVPTDQGTQGNFEGFFQLGKSGKTGAFSQNQGKKFQIRELFPQTIFRPFKPTNLRKMFFLRLLNLRSCQEIGLNEAIFA